MTGIYPKLLTLRRSFMKWETSPIKISNPARLFSTTRLSLSAAQRAFVLTERVGEKKNVGLITLNRPEALNSINNGLTIDLKDAIEEFQKDSQIGAIIITGQGKAFAAGGDIKEMSNLTFAKVFNEGFPANWLRMKDYSKPIIAAVNGYALGGGCEITMLCDMAYASDTAIFGQPEILLGTIPAGGGTQNIPRFTGKSKAMEMCLTGERISAQEAERMDLVSKVFPADKLLPETLKIAEKIANNSQIIVAMIKEAINRGFETTLQEGLQLERSLAQASFATEDQKEGMTAFIEKRPPRFQNK